MTDGGVRFLDDVRVLEIANLAPTQLAMHLADLGADVIKIEPPQRGDATRLIGLRPGYTDSGLHRRWNRGKKSLALDTTTPAGVDILRRLISEVDVMIEGLRPGTMEKMGLGWSDITALKPDIVMVALSGYGQAGPYRDLPSHGIGFDAVSGLAVVEDDELGRPTVPPRHVNLGTNLAPLFGATAVLAALSWSRRTGRPVLLDVAQADAAAFANLAIEDQAAEQRAIAAGSVTFPPAAPQVGAGAQVQRPTMQAYRTRDGRLLLLMALERKFFVRLAEAVGRPDLLEHVRDQYLTTASKEVDDAMIDILSSKDLSEWMEIFAAADVPVVPVNESSQVLEDSHLSTRIEWLDADQGTVTMKTPVHSEPSIASPRQAPAIGQDTAEILASIGIDRAEIDRLAGVGVIQLAPEV